MTKKKIHSSLPYDTGKVLIGSKYNPDKRPRITRDSEIIQAAYLYKKKPRLFKRNTLGLALMIFIILLAAGLSL